MNKRTIASEDKYSFLLSSSRRDSLAVIPVFYLGGKYVATGKQTTN
jgi:hypothetical protein